MAPIKIYTMLVSQPARAVSWACLFEGTQVEEVQVMPGKDTRTEAYIKQNPIPAVPRLEEGDFVLNESHAIMCYLGDKFKWKLYPADPQVRARIHQYMNWHHQNTRRITNALFAPVVRPDLPLHPATIEQWIKETKNTFTALEQWLSQSKWLCGDMPTVADLSCYCEVGQCLDKFTGMFAINGIDLAPYPGIVAWLAECEKLVGWEKSHEVLKKIAPRFNEMAKKRASKL
mmetsp:Transcript_29682/g.75561  ORF Transcript_29682/g.75561 Transcript_29682/m.75561 type:complete len:230 (-) Transcript_29682:39-728(-)